MKMIVLPLFCFLITVAFADNEKEIIWKEYKKNFTKVYDFPNEEEFRKNIFFRSLDKIEKHNERFQRGEISYRLGINQFSDTEKKEFQRRTITSPHLTKFNLTLLKKESDKPTLALTRGSLPKHFDWRTKGAVTSVKDQIESECGSCYSVTAVGALEGQVFFKTQKLYNFSIQQAIDCSWKFDNKGCAGGLAPQVFHYLKKTDGITFDKDYPYNAADGKCLAKKRHLDSIRVKGYVMWDDGDEENLKKQLVSRGPIASQIHMDGIEDYQGYGGGIINSDKCDPNNINHAVLIVGYGTTDQGDDYWIFKNSHGPDWGENGYGRIARNKNNHCGIARLTSYPILVDGKILKAKKKKSSLN